MITNPFISQTRNPFAEEIGNATDGESVPGSAARNDPGHTDVATRPAQFQKRFFKFIGCLLMIFVVLVFSVFREVKHSRELFHMNQLLAAAEAEKRQWQELQRLDEAREALLMAQLLRLQSLTRDTRDPLFVNAAYNLPPRRY